MSRIKNRLRSRRGASITFALLLFLVCAVLSSVILVAATTAAGRMARMAETDRRYYAVTSASALLKEVINGKTVTVATVTKSRTGENTYIDGRLQGTVSSTYTNDSGYPIVYVVNGSADGMSAEELAAASPSSDPPVTRKESTTKLSTVLEDAAYRYYSTPAATFPASGLTGSFTLKSTDEGTDPLEVAINEKILSDGTLVLTLSAPAGTGTFQQQLVFTCMVDDGTSATTSDEVTGSSVTASNQIRTLVRTNKTEITTKKMTWTLGGVNSIGGGT